MLVVEDRHRTLALLEDPDNLLVEPPAWIIFLPDEIVVIDPVLSDEHHPIHGQFLAAEREGFSNCVEDRNVFDLHTFWPKPLSGS